MAVAVNKVGIRGRAAVDIPEGVFWAVALLLIIEYVGLAAEFSVIRVTRFATVLAYATFAVVLANHGLGYAFAARQGRLFLGLVTMAAASIFYAVVKSYVPAALRGQIDYFVLFAVAAAFFDQRHRVTKLAVVGTLIVLALVARNMDLLTSGERVGVFRAGYFLGDGNDFAWGLIALMPLPLFLMLGKHGLMSRMFGVLGLATVVFGVVGTQSRGATLAVVAAGLYYVLVLSRRRLVSVVVLGVLVVGAVALSPDSYIGRVTDTDVAADSSAQGRIRAWTAATKMAIDYPLGVGFGSFNSAYGRFYMQEADNVFDYGARRWISAHSIYFKVLGESGVIGLSLLLGILWTTYRDNQQSLRFALDRPRECTIEDRWPALLNVGLVGFAVAGAFLGGLSYPHLYLLAGLAVACRRMTVDRVVDGTPDVSQPRAKPVTAMAGRPKYDIALEALRARDAQFRTSRS
jgi:putative inorganic carbon (hco3(-)) transporter